MLYTKLSKGGSKLLKSLLFRVGCIGESVESCKFDASCLWVETFKQGVLRKDLFLLIWYDLGKQKGCQSFKMVNLSTNEATDVHLDKRLKFSEFAVGIKKMHISDGSEEGDIDVLSQGE